MSEGVPLRGVVVCHGPLAGAMVAAVESISGIHGALVAVSNSGCDRGTLEERVEAAVGDAPTVVFVDMASGSCLFAVLHRLRSRPTVGVVTGVNLAMLIDFVFNRDTSPALATARAVEVGSRAIGVSV